MAIIRPHLQRAYSQAVLVVVAAAGAVLINVELQLLFDRQRPDPIGTVTMGSSAAVFGETVLHGAVLYGLLSYFLGRHYRRSARWIHAAAALLIMAIGFSRVYLQTRWPLEVLTGWVIGILWLGICIVLLRLQQLRQDARRKAKLTAITAEGNTR